MDLTSLLALIGISAVTAAAVFVGVMRGPKLTPEQAAKKAHDEFVASITDEQWREMAGSWCPECQSQSCIRPHG